jgi:isopenicillin N synthase-like dioxygenase
MSTLKHFSSIPIIDISQLSGGEMREQRKVADQLGRAASEIGLRRAAYVAFQER